MKQLCEMQSFVATVKHILIALVLCHYVFSYELLINEINAISSTWTNREYLELVKLNCKETEKLDLSSYGLIIIKEFEVASSAPVIVFSADFDSLTFFDTREYQFFCCCRSIGGKC